MKEYINSFEIKDPDIDTNEVKKIIAARIDERRRYARVHSINFEEMAQSVSLEKDACKQSLNLIEFCKAAILLKPYAISSQQTGLNYILSWLRKQIHNLVIYYVNILGRKQILFNESVAQVIAIHQTQLEESLKRIRDLEEKVESLEALLMAAEVERDE